MELRTGKVIQGKIVLDDTENREEGTQVAVWIDEPKTPVRLTPEEEEIVRQGRASAARGELLDAETFLRELQRGH